MTVKHLASQCSEFCKFYGCHNLLPCFHSEVCANETFDANVWNEEKIKMAHKQGNKKRLTSHYLNK